MARKVIRESKILGEGICGGPSWKQGLSAFMPNNLVTRRDSCLCAFKNATLVGSLYASEAEEASGCVAASAARWY